MAHSLLRKVLRGVATGLAAVVAGAAGLALASTGVAAQDAYSGFYEARVLEPAASFVAKKSVMVWCARSASAWRAYLVSVYGVVGLEHGSAPFGGSEVYLDTQACPPLRDAVAVRPVYVPALAAVVEILTHEAIHARGERDEGVTDCAAMHEMPGVAVRFFHVKAGKALRELMAAAWSYHRKAASQYRSVC